VHRIRSDVTLVIRSSVPGLPVAADRDVAVRAGKHVGRGAATA
jgi:hypothetical protein